MGLNERLKHLDRAFGMPPRELSDSVELAFERGIRASHRRHRTAAALSVAAIMLVLVGALALTFRQLTAPRRDSVAVAQGGGSGHGTGSLGAKATPGAEAFATPAVEYTEAPWDEAATQAVPTPEPEQIAEQINSEEAQPLPTPAALPEDITIVYAMANGNYYHADAKCSGMENAVAWTEASARTMGKQPCPVCLGSEGINGAILESEDTKMAATEIEAPVYYTAGGTYYHGLEHCSGMMAAEAHTLMEAHARGKKRCPACQPGVPDHYDLFIAAFGQGLEALTPGYAYSYYSGDTGYWEDCQWNVTDGEDTRAACRAISALKEDGGEFRAHMGTGNTLENVILFVFESEEWDETWPFLSKTNIGEKVHREMDDAAIGALEEAALDEPVNLVQQDVWVAVDAEGEILELDVDFLSDDSTVYVCLSYSLSGDGYDRNSRVVLSDPFYDDPAEPVSITEEAEEITRRRYICDSDLYYHADLACPMLSGQRIRAVSRAEAAAAGRGPCPMCQPDRPQDESLFLMAFGREMLSALYPDYYYAFTRSSPYSGEDCWYWYMRSRDAEDDYAEIAAFQMRTGEGESMPSGFEEDGVRMIVWMNTQVDYASMLKNSAPEFMRDLMIEAEKMLLALPDLESKSIASPLQWNATVCVCFDAARERITSVELFIDGPEEVRFEWQRTEAGDYALSQWTVNGEARK